MRPAASRGEGQGVGRDGQHASGHGRVVGGPQRCGAGPWTVLALAGLGSQRRRICHAASGRRAGPGGHDGGGGRVRVLWCGRAQGGPGPGASPVRPRHRMGSRRRLARPSGGTSGRCSMCRFEWSPRAPVRAWVPADCWAVGQKPWAPCGPIDSAHRAPLGRGSDGETSGMLQSRFSAPAGAPRWRARFGSVHDEGEASIKDGSGDLSGAARG